MRLFAVLCLLAALPGCGGDDDGGSSDHPDAAGGGDAGGSDGGGGSMLEVTGIVGSQGAPTPGPLAWLAAQDGDGPWQVLDAGEDGVYRMPVTSGRYGVAYYCPKAVFWVAGQGIIFVYDTMDAHPAIERRCIDDTAPSYGQVNATVSDLDADGEATLNIGSSSLGLTQAAPSGLIQTWPGSWDGFLVVRPNGTKITRVVLERDVTVNDGGATGLSMSATAGAAAAVVALAVGGAGGDSEEHRVWFHTASGSRGLLTKVTNQDMSRAVPAEILVPDDMHELEAEASGTATVRSASRWFHEPVDVSLTLPAPMSAVTVNGETGAPYGRATFSFDAVDGATAYRGAVTQNGQVEETGVVFTISPAWLGAGDQVSWTMPDFSDLDGFDPAWTLVEGQGARWLASVVTTGRDLYDVTDEQDFLQLYYRPKAEWDGKLDTASSRVGTFTP